MNLLLLTHRHFHLTFNEIYQLLLKVHPLRIVMDKESSKLYLSKKLPDQKFPMECSVVCNYKDFLQIQFFVQIQIWNELTKKCLYFNCWKLNLFPWCLQQSRECEQQWSSFWSLESWSAFFRDYSSASNPKFFGSVNSQ